jgi:UDP-glucose 4-epimerase
MIIVTGATGFLGTYLVKTLRQQGVEVFAAGRVKSGEHYYRNLDIPFARIDITNRKDFDLLPSKDVDAVVHLAAIIPEHMRENTTGGDLLLVNALGTWNALDYCRRNGIKKFVYTTSHYEVSNVKELPIGEEVIDYINNGNHVEYIIAKIAGAQYVKYFMEEYGLQGIVLRTTCIRGYSPYASLHKDVSIRRSHWENFLYKAYRGEPIEIWGDCTTHLRDHLYVKDAISCLVAAINSSKALGRYNMASGKGITFEEEIKSIVRVFSSPERISELVYRPEMSNEIDRSWVYDITKTKNDLNWEPKYSTEEYLEDIKRDMIADGQLR